MATVCTTATPSENVFEPRGWSRPARRQPAPRGHSFYVESLTEDVIRRRPARAQGRTARTTAQVKVDRRSRERRRVIFDAVFTALGVKPRGYPQTPEGRLGRALSNVASDRHRGGF